MLEWQFKKIAEKNFKSTNHEETKKKETGKAIEASESRTLVCKLFLVILFRNHRFNV